MKIGGIIFIVFGVLNFIIAISMLVSGYDGTSKIGAAIMFLVIGAFMLSRAKKKKEEEEEKEKWRNGNQ